MNKPMMNAESWPELDWEVWKDTAETLHMFTQIVGKTRAALTPTQNHWWNVPLSITARGLSTSAMPVRASGLLDIEFDFIAHELVFRHSSGRITRMALRPQTVAAFFAEYEAVLTDLGVQVVLDPMPVELKAPIRFDQDTTHKSYDAAASFSSHEPADARPHRARAARLGIAPSLTMTQPPCCRLKGQRC